LAPELVMIDFGHRIPRPRELRRVRRALGGQNGPADVGTRGILVLAVRERATVVGRWASDSIGVLHGIEPLDMRFQKQVARAAEGRGGSVAAPGACAVIVTEILAVTKRRRRLGSRSQGSELWAH
jgi:hypothetical protein